MPTFAHTETGKALDPQVSATAQEYAARFSSAVTSNWTIVQVPDGTSHNANDNGNGTFTNSAPPSLAPSNKCTGLSWYEFRCLLTDAEIMSLDNWADGAITLTTPQKRNLATGLEDWKARGADNLIDVTTAKSAAQIDFLIARGFIDGTGGTRKAEIISGVKKS